MIDTRGSRGSSTELSIVITLITSLQTNLTCTNNLIQLRRDGGNGQEDQVAGRGGNSGCGRDKRNRD